MAASTTRRATTAAAKGAKGTADMTGAAIAAFCEAGVPAWDPQVARAIEFLHENLTENGGFKYPFGGPNGDSNAWAVGGLNACGIDPQSAGWTTAAGKTPVDFLLSLQIHEAGPANGAFGYQEPEGANFYNTQETVRALAGGAFTAAPKTVRTPPSVADGTPVRHLLAVKLGGESVRMCEVTAPSGAPLTALLEAAQAGSNPAGCVESLSIAGGQVVALDGVAAPNADEAWLARMDGGAAALAGEQPVAFGDLVSLWIGTPPAGGSGDGTAGPAGATGATGPAGATGAAGPQGEPAARAEGEARAPQEAQAGARQAPQAQARRAAQRGKGADRGKPAHHAGLVGHARRAGLGLRVLSNSSAISSTAPLGVGEVDETLPLGPLAFLVDLHRAQEVGLEALLRLAVAVEGPHRLRLAERQPVTGVRPWRECMPTR